MADRVLRAGGRDFSPVKEAEFHEWKNGAFIPCGEEERRKLLPVLDAFLEEYRRRGKKDLRFYANRELFGPDVGVTRIRNLAVRDPALGEATYDFTLQLGCRFDSGGRAWFLAAMLTASMYEEFQKPSVQISQQTVFDILLFFMFREQFAQAARKGIFRAYRRFEENGPRPRGALDIPRHIRLNGGLNNGRIACAYREHTENNRLNRLIAAAFRRLRERFPGLVRSRFDNDSACFQAMTAITQAVGPQPLHVRTVLAENLRPIAHPYFGEYEALRKTCLKILRYENISIFDADCCEETESLLVDVPRLWERFLERRLETRLEGSGLHLTAQDPRPIFAQRDDKLSRPDFVLRRGGQALAILDAKFKRHWEDFFIGSSSKYVDDDINKCIRDMVVFQTRRTGVVFPFREANGENGPYHKAYQIGKREDAPGFDMVRVPVPPEGEMSFADWYQVLERAVDRALGDYLQSLL